jgi:hypothetical protein
VTSDRHEEVGSHDSPEWTSQLDSPCSRRALFYGRLVQSEPPGGTTATAWPWRRSRHCGGTLRRACVRCATSIGTAGELLELSFILLLSAIETRSAVSNEEGDASFETMTPAFWRLRVVESDDWIPDGGEVDFWVPPGETAECERFGTASSVTVRTRESRAGDVLRDVESRLGRSRRINISHDRLVIRTSVGRHGASPKMRRCSRDGYAPRRS